MTSAATSVKAQVNTLSRAATAASCVAFVVMGMVQALYGPAFPFLRSHFGLTPAGAGVSLSAHFLGALLGVLASFWLRWKLTDRLALGASYGLMAAGSAGFALAPSWPLALVSAFVLGAGFGGLDYGLNRMFAVGFGERSNAMLNFLNAFFGVGAILGPAVIGWISPSRYAAAFGACAVVSAVLVLSVWGVRRVPPPPTAAVVRGAYGVVPLRRSMLVIAAFLVVYVLHVAIETGVGAWEPTYLISIGHSVGGAASATALYWLTMTVGRFLIVPVRARWQPGWIVTVGCLGMMVFLALASVPRFAVLAYAGVGLAIAPIFATGLAWLNQVVPGIERASAYVTAAAMVGGIAFPPILGTLIQVTGTGSVPWVLFALAGGCGLPAVWVWFHTRAHRRAAAGHVSGGLVEAEPEFR